jgi:hypothetical protein
MGQRRTLSNAYNDNTVNDGIDKEEVQDAARYAFVDSRGFLVERGTHSTTIRD